MPNYSTHAISYNYKEYGEKQNRQKEKIRQKFNTNNLKAPTNNVKIQSDKTLTTKIYLFISTKQMQIYIFENR